MGQEGDRHHFSGMTDKGADTVLASVCEPDRVDGEGGPGDHLWQTDERTEKTCGHRTPVYCNCSISTSSRVSVIIEATQV